MIDSGLLCIRILLAKTKLKNGRKEYLWLILCWKLILGRIKSKIWTKKKIYIDITTKRYFATSDYTKFKREICETKIKERGLVDNLVRNSSLVKNYDLNKNLAKLARKAELKAEQLKSWHFKRFIQAIFVVKVILKMNAHKINKYFSQSVDILKRLLILIKLQKDCLVRELNLLLHLMIVLL